MATVMGSELFQLLKEQQETWGNFLTAMLTKLESIERGSTQTDGAVHIVENHAVVNLEDDIQTEANFIPICDAQPSRAVSVIEGNVVFYPESVQPPIQYSHQQRMQPNPSSFSSQYVSIPKRKEEISTIQYSKWTIAAEKEHWRITDEHFSMLQENQTKHEELFSYWKPLFTLTDEHLCRTHKGITYIFKGEFFDRSFSIKRIKLPLDPPVFSSLLSSYMRMRGKLNIRRLHRIQQPFEDGFVLRG